jgi:hypothetical protein
MATYDHNIQTVDAVADLANVSMVTNQQVQTLGYYAPSDGGGNTYRYDSGSSDTIDGGFVIDGPGSVGRFIAVDQTVANAKQFGAVGDGIADDSGAIEDAIHAADTTGGGIVFFPQGSYSHSAAAITNDSIELTGPGLPNDIEGGAPRQVSGTGSPEGVVTAPLASIYQAVDSGDIWRKDSGAGNTGWSVVPSGDNTEFVDSTFRIFDNVDSTKRVAFEASGITTATTRTLTVPDADGEIALLGTIGIGLIAQEGAATTVIATNSTDWTNKVQVTSFASDGSSNDVITPDHTNDHVTVNKDGIYRLMLTGIAAGGNNAEYRFGIFVNNGATEVSLAHARIIMNGNGDNATIALQGYYVATAGDTFEVWVERQAGAGNIAIDNLYLSVEER